MSIFTALLPMIVALGGAVLTLAADGFGKRSAAVALAVAGLLGAGAVAASMAVGSGVTEVPGLPLAVGAGYSAVSAFVYLLAAVVLVGGSKVLGDRSNGGEIAALTVLLALASSVMVAARDLLIVTVALETIAIVSYALVSVARTRRADEAAMKYFVQGAVATGFLLYAVSLIFGLYGGDLSLSGMMTALAEGPARPALIALALLLMTYAFKLSAFPFHSWAPDAYETAIPSVTAFMGTAPKLAVLGSLMTVLPLIGFSDGSFATTGFFLVALLAVASIVFGNFTGLKQARFTRMLAYSGIAQVGYALVGAAAVFLLPVADRSAYGVLAAGGAYALAAAGAFMGAQAMHATVPGWDGSIAGVAGLGRRRPMLGAALVVLMLSLTGIPLTAGFWGKFLVFSDAVAAGHAWLAVVGMIGSVVSFGYYGNVMRVMYLDEPARLPAVSVGAEKSAGAADPMAEFAVAALALLVLALGVLPFLLGFDFLGKILTVL